MSPFTAAITTEKFARSTEIAAFGTEIPAFDRDPRFHGGEIRFFRRESRDRDEQKRAHRAFGWLESRV
jgi:hypothetical protein